MEVEDINQIALALSMTNNVVPGDWSRLDRTPREVWDLLRTSAGCAELGARLGHRVGPIDWAAFDHQLARMEACRAAVVSRWDARYPWRLRQVASPPPVVFVRGDVGLFEGPAIAIVGTRVPSSAGVAFATRLARAMAARGVAVVSGLARGIDTAAHRGALEGTAGTVAVLGTGVDVVYPSENGALMDRVIGDGCVVSEQMCGTIAAPFVFPRRNRIISGLSEGIVVVEGGVRSGALITARWALEQGREVGAVPGFPGDFRSGGPNRLIKQGAFVVEDATDVFDNIPRLGVGSSIAVAPCAASTESPDAATDRVYDLLARDADADEVARASGLSVERVQEILTRLQIDGRVVRGDGGRFARAD